ncbi:MAG TPA: SH3 domain-containing protein [Roseiflexaceae bacterium]|nr:SH3 domain-containing protein [Roseiflexaceae bacterium]
MDTEQIYRLGMADAERGDPNPFYYQHYYHYRRGYDQARRRMRRPLPWQKPGRYRGAALLVVLLAIGGIAWLALGPRGPSTAARPTPPPATPADLLLLETAVPASTLFFPTDTPPTPAPPVLQAGGRAVVANLQGQILNARTEPRLNARVQARLANGDAVQVLEGPVQADGFTWWRIESPKGSGWSAERSKDGVVWLQPPAP